MKDHEVAYLMGTADTSIETQYDLPEWPKNLAEQAQAVQRALQQQERPIKAEGLYQHFRPGSKATKAQRIQQIDSLLQTFSTLGLLRETDQGQYVK